MRQHQAIKEHDARPWTVNCILIRVQRDLCPHKVLVQCGWGGKAMPVPPAEVRPVEAATGQLNSPLIWPRAAAARLKFAAGSYLADDLGAYWDLVDPVCDMIAETAESWAAFPDWIPGPADY